MNNNHFSYMGALAFMPPIRNTANGGQFLPVTLKAESSSASIALFDRLAVLVANTVATGQTLHIEGWITSRKNSRTGFFEVSLNAQRLSLDGKTWHTAEPRPVQQPVQQQQVQAQPLQQKQTQGFQQPLNNSGQAQQQQQQSQSSPQQGQAVQQAQPQQMAQPQQVAPQQQPQTPAQQQASMAEFLNTNQYRQGQPPSQAATQAQAQLYGQNQAVPAQPVQQQHQAVQGQVDEFESMDIPF